MKMVESAGFTFRYVGLLGRLLGRYPRAAAMAACTSRAAASMLRLRSNCNVILHEPSELDEVISVTEAMRPNWRSSGVATEEAMVSGLAPGRLALTEMVGKSTCGSGATGSSPNAVAPAFLKGIDLAFVISAVLTSLAAVASLMRGGRYVHELHAEVPRREREPSPEGGPAEPMKVVADADPRPGAGP
jgi:hypothetical protein